MKSTLSNDREVCISCVPVISTRFYDVRFSVSIRYVENFVPTFITESGRLRDHSITLLLVLKLNQCEKVEKLNWIQNCKISDFI